MENSEYEKRMSMMSQWSDSVRSELVNLISDSPPKFIYHYTDINGLLGLIESGNIWATHVSRLNDSSEYHHGIKFVTDYVRDNMPHSPQPLVEKVLSEFKRVDTYIACYSTKHDLLSQWRSYSGVRVGYCLGFATEEMATPDEKMPLLEPVIYKDGMAKTVLARLLHKVDKFLNTNDFGEVEVGYLLGMIEATLNTLACMIKHHKFEEENEFRQFYQPGATSLKLEPYFRNGRFGLTPYVKIRFLEDKRLPLSSVTVGPCQDVEAEVNALTALLAKYGYSDVEVRASEIPLRM